MGKKIEKNKKPGFDIYYCTNEYQKQGEAKSTAKMKAKNICL